MLFSKGKSKQPPKTNILQNPKILEVNLIRDEVVISFDWNKNLSILAVVLFITGLFVVEIYFGLSWWEEQEIKNSQAISEDLISLNKEISEIQKQADSSLAYKAKAAEVAKLLSDHVYWSNLFSWLEKNTLSTVRYSGFSGTLSGAYSLSAVASSLADVSWQAKALMDDPLTKHVEIGGAAVSGGGGQGAAGSVSFNMLLEVNPDIFKK